MTAITFEQPTDVAQPEKEKVGRFNRFISWVVDTYSSPDVDHSQVSRHDFPHQSVQVPSFERTHYNQTDWETKMTLAGYGGEFLDKNMPFGD